MQRPGIMLDKAGAIRHVEFVERTSFSLIRHDASAILLRILMFEISLWSIMMAWNRLEITVCWRD